MRPALVLLLGAAAGCNQLLGLDPTERADADAAIGRDSGSPVDAIACDPTGGVDEDSDTYPDSCDLCPHIAGDQDDSDGDGVGDACDPLEGRDDDILFFDGFSVEPDGWIPVRGSWLVSDGALYQANAIEASSLVYHSFALPRETVVSTAIDVQEVHDVGSPIASGLRVYTLDLAQLEPDGYECRISRATRSTSTVDVHAWDTGVAATIGSETLAVPYDLGAHFDVQFLHAADGGMRCDVTSDPEMAKTDATSTLYGSGVIALRTVRTHAAFRYVIAIGPAEGG